MEKREPSYTVGGNASWYNHYGEQYRGSYKKLKITPYDPAIPLLGIYSEETKIEIDTCISLLIAALFTITETWKPPKCPLTEKRIKKMWYKYARNITQP